MLSTNILKEALTIQQHENRHITYADLAKLAGFNEEEQHWAGIFWEPAYNGTMIYLSDELITDWLGFNGKDNAVADFKYKVLRTRYVLNLDYFEVSYDHELVVKYKTSILSKKATQSDCIDLNLCKTKRGGSNKQHFIITGATFKDMLMNARTDRGKKIRTYYLKTEVIAGVMTKCINSMYEIVINDLRKECNTKQEHIFKLNKTIEELKSMMESQSGKVDQLLDYAKDTNDQLIDVNTQLEIAHDTIKDVTDEVQLTREQVVVPDLDPQNEYVHIYKHSSLPKEYNAIRCQKRSLKVRTAACKSAGYDIYVYGVATPNAVNLWNRLKSGMTANIGKIHHTSKITLYGDEQMIIDLINEKNDEKYTYGD